MYVLSLASSRALPLLALSAVLAFGPVATLHAAPPAAEGESAERLLEEGDALAGQGELHSALIRYRSAHALLHTPITGLRVARTQVKLGKLLEARSSALEIAELAPASPEPARQAEARVAARQLAEALARRVPTIGVHVIPQHAAYSVSLDGVRIPLSKHDEPQDANPGLHVLRVEAPGYLADTQQIELAEGQQFTTSVQLRQVVAAVLPEETLQPPAAGPDPKVRTRAIVALSAGGAVFVLGAVSGVMAAVKYGTLTDQCPANKCPPARSGQLSTANTLANIANVSIPLGLVGIGYGLYELLTLDRGDRARRPGLQLGLAHDGVVLGGAL